MSETMSQNIPVQAQPPAPVKKKKAGLIILAAVVVAMALAATACIFLFRKSGYRSLEVLESYGDTSVYRDDKELKAYEGMLLRSGDYLTVREDSYLRMRLDDDKYVYLEGQALMKLSALGNKKDGRTQIELELGTMVTEVENRLTDDASYEIYSPNTTMAIRGTTTVSEVRYQIPEGHASLTEEDILDYLVATRVDASEDADKADEVEELMEDGMSARISSYVQNGKVELMVFEKEADGKDAKLTASYVTVKKGNGLSTTVDQLVSPQVIALVEVDEDGELSFAESEEAEELTKDFEIKAKRNKAETIEELNDMVASYQVAPMENLDSVQLKLDLDELSIGSSTEGLQHSFEEAVEEAKAAPTPTATPTPTPYVEAENVPTTAPEWPWDEEEPDWDIAVDVGDGPIQYDEFNLLWDYVYADGTEDAIGIVITDIEETGRMRNETVIIPSMVAGLPVLEIGDSAFNGKGDIEEVVLPNTVQSLGEFAFNQCIDLVRIELPDSVTVLEKGVFAGCISLKEVKLSSSLKTIPYLAFSGCRELESLVIPYGVELLDGASIRDCYLLKHVLVPGSVTEIGLSAFAEAEELHIYIGESLNYDTVESYNFDDEDVVYVHENTELAEYGYETEYILVDEGIRITVSANPNEDLYVYNGLEQSVMQDLGIADMELKVPGPCTFTLPEGAEYTIFSEADYYFPGSLADIAFDQVPLDWTSGTEYMVEHDGTYWTAVCARVPNGDGYTYYLTPRIRVTDAE